MRSLINLAIVIDPKMILFILNNAPRPPLKLRGGEGELFSFSFMRRIFLQDEERFRNDSLRMKRGFSNDHICKSQELKVRSKLWR
jgi:hypothetical protein